MSDYECPSWCGVLGQGICLGCENAYLRAYLRDAKVKTWENAIEIVGKHSHDWKIKGHEDRGNGVVAGVYFFHMKQDMEQKLAEVRLDAMDVERRRRNG